MKSGKSTGLHEKSVKILQCLQDNPEGLRVRTLKKLLSSPERTVYRHLKRLEQSNLVINLYPIWKVQALSKKWQTLLRSDNIQNHKFSFVLKLIRKPHWWKKRGNRLMKLKEYDFKNVNWGNVNMHQMERDDFIIQFFPNSIVIIDRKHHWGSSVYDCMIDSVNDIFEIIRFLEERYSIQLTLDGVPHMNIKSHHYVDLNNAFAKRCKEKNDKGFMVEVDGERRVWVDMSIPFGLEYGHKDHAPDDYKKLYPFMEDLLKMDEPVRLSDLLKVIQAQQNQINSLLYRSPDPLNKKDSYFG